MKQTRAKKVKITPQPNYIAINTGLPPDSFGFACCPYCNSKITAMWRKVPGNRFGWVLLNQCEHLRGIEDKQLTLAFIKNVDEIRKLNIDYVDLFGREVAMLNKPWIFLDNSTKKCD